MKLSTRTTTFAAAIALALPGAAIAQNNVSSQANDVAQTAQQLEQEANTLASAAEPDTAAGREEGDRRGEDRRGGDDDDFPWGLLGLLGLAGLLGLKRRDDGRHDRDYARTTATGDRTGTTTDRRL